MDWTKFTNDPCDIETQGRMQAYLDDCRIIAPTKFYVEWFIERIRGKSCLDIGCVEHDLSYTEKPSWKHRQVVDVASRAVGVDILEEPARILNERGYDIRICDATSDTDLGERFECVILGDVIEHVENPVSLLRFAMRHLADGGEVIVKTPNPYYIDNFMKAAKCRFFVNFEHLAWYTPTMALEIARRTGCTLANYVIFPRKNPWCKLFPKTDIFTNDFVYIFRHKQD